MANRIQGLLANQGLRVDWRKPLPRQLDALRSWNGAALPQGLRARLDQERERLELLNRQIEALEATRRERIRAEKAEPAVGTVNQLLPLQGVGSNSAWLYVMEFFAWRQFRNRREVGALAGLTPTPYQSGESHRRVGAESPLCRRVRLASRPLDGASATRLRSRLLANTGCGDRPSADTDRGSSQDPIGTLHGAAHSVDLQE